MGDNYDTTKNSVKYAYAAVFNDPTRENKTIFMRYSDAFREAIRQREVVAVVVTPVEDAAAKTSAAAKAAAEKEAADKAVADAKAAAEKAAAEKAVADAKAAADKAAAVKAAAEKVALDALEKKKLTDAITVAYTKFFTFCNSRPDSEAAKTFFSKFSGREIISSYNSDDIATLQTKKSEIESGGSVFSEFNKIYQKLTGNLYVGIIPSTVPEKLDL